MPSGLCKAELSLTPSLSTEIAFARSDCFDIAPSFIFFGAPEGEGACGGLIRVA
jgi:hypothetical protein